MMIEKFTEQQKELFGQFEGTQEKRKSSKLLGKEERLSLSVSFDTLLLFGILLVMVCVLIYSTGVEIGRHHQKMLPVNEQKEAERKEKEGALLQSPESLPPSIPLQVSKPLPKPVEKKPAEKKGEYTIQVLSYRQSQPAEQALSTLRKKGFSAFFLTGPQGIAVCVGNFTNSSEAQKTFKELKTLYPDCFIRKR